MTDGYHGAWQIAVDTNSAPSPAWPWPLKPKIRPTLFSVRQEATGSYIWTCRECGEELTTETFERPAHPTCRKR